MAGELYKALTRANGLQGAWDSVRSLFLSKKLKELKDTTPSQVPTAPPTLPSENTGASGAGQLKVPPVLPDTAPPPPPPQETQPSPPDNTVSENYIPPSMSGEAGSPKGSTTNAYIPPPPTPTKSIVGDKSQKQLQDEQYNEQMKRKLEDYIAYASRFGTVANPFIESAKTMYALNYKQPEQIPEFKPGMIQTDKEGKQWQQVYDPTSRKYYAVPLTDQAGNQMQTELPKQEKLTPVRINGNVAFMNNNGDIVKQTDVPWTDYSENADTFDKIQASLKMAEDKLATQIQLKGMGNKGRGGPTAGDLGKTLMYNGKPINLLDAKSMGIETVYKQLFSGNPKVRKQAMDIINVTPGFSWADNTNIINPQMTYDMNSPEGWKRLFYDQVNNWKNGATDAIKNQALEWLKKPENQAYAKKLGIK